MDHCHSCGAPVKRRKNVCPHCGVSLQRTAGTDATSRTKTTVRSVRTVDEEAPPREVSTAREEEPAWKKKEPNEWLFPVGDGLGRFLWGALGFLVPPLGLLLFFTLIERRPGIAVCAGTGAFLGVISIFPGLHDRVCRDPVMIVSWSTSGLF